MKNAVLSIIKLLDINLQPIKLEEISLQNIIGAFSSDKSSSDRGRYRTVDDELYRLADGGYYLVKPSKST